MTARRWLTAAVLLAAAPRRGAAQDDYFHRHSRWYFSAGVGAGQFKLTCDSCPGTTVNANLISGWFGYHVSPRLRIEAAFQYMERVGVRSHASSISAHAVHYPLGNLFLRGGVATLNASWEDSIGVTEGKGGPGFSVGAGYDLFLSNRFALTPFANYYGGKISSLTYDAGAGTTTVPGNVSAYNAGIALSWKRRPRNTQ